jgi:hypothetical protein
VLLASKTAAQALLGLSKERPDWRSPRPLAARGTLTGFSPGSYDPNAIESQLSEEPMNRLLAVFLLLLPSLAFGQEAKKFDAKDLEKELAPLAVFHEKAKVVDNEVVVTVNPDYDSYEAVYVVKAPVKKVVEHYKSKLGIEPAKQGTEDLGDVKLIFAPKAHEGDKRVYRATIEPLEDGRVQITLLRRAITDDDEVVEDEEGDAE